MWLSEYGRPTALARVAESTVEMLAGEPSVVLALFGTLLFDGPALGFLSQTTTGVVFGQSFFAAGGDAVAGRRCRWWSRARREGLQAIPSHVREASYAVGKTKIATTRRVLLPAARPSVITGTMLGLGRVIGDTAIVLLLLGGTLERLQGADSIPVLGLLRGDRQHADRLHLLQRADRRRQPAVQGVRGGVRADADGARAQPRRRHRLRRRAKEVRMELRKPPPVRRLTGRRGRHAAEVRAPPAPAGTDGNGRRSNGERSPPGFGFAAAPAGRRATARSRSTACRSRTLSVAYGDQARRQVGLAADPPGRGARADRTVGLRQDDAAALAQPAHRADPDRVALSGRITLDGVDIATIEPTALRRRVTMVFQQPNPFPMSVFDNVAYVLREQASRRPRKSRRRAAGARRARACRAARRGRGQPRPPGAAAVRRPAAASVHRPRAGRPPRGPAARRALLGARSAVDQGDRGADRQAARRRRGRDRHPQPAAGLPDRRLRRRSCTSASSSSTAARTTLFGSPREQRTQDYVSGAFG